MDPSKRRDGTGGYRLFFNQDILIQANIQAGTPNAGTALIETGPVEEIVKIEA